MRDKTVTAKVISYIESNLDKDLSLDELAKELHYSKFYLARIFSENMECTIYQYIKGRRLTEAARKLVKTKQPIVEIALEAHYNSQQAFTLAFKQLYLYTPQAYRKNGIFYPKQNRIKVQSISSFSCMMYHMTGRRMAA